MNIKPPFSASNTIFLTDESSKNTQKSALGVRMLAWWYRLAAPSEPPATVNLIQREVFRRGQIASLMLLVMIAIFVAFMGEGFTNPAIFIIVVPALCLNILAIFLNRRGLIVLVAILLIAEIELPVADAGGLLDFSKGISLYSLGIFDLFVAAEVIAAALLTPKSVFVVAFLNIILIWIGIRVHPAPDLAHAIATTSIYNVIARPIILQLVVALAMYVWGSSVIKALIRADRAEAMATLQQALAQQQHALAQEKQQLERSIQYIVETQTRVANGDLNARVPLTQENVLWQVAGSFNNLLTRFQRLHQDAYELQKLRNETTRLIAALREAREGQHSIRFARSGTALDVLAMEINRDRSNIPIQ